MAFNVDISPSFQVLSGQDGNTSVIDKSNYDVLCYYKTDKINFSTGTTITLNTGHNKLIALGKNKYYGYCIQDIELSIDPIKATIKLKDPFSQNQYESGKLSVTYTGDAIKPIPCLSIDQQLIQDIIEPWSFNINTGYKNENISVDGYTSYTYTYSNNVENASTTPSYVNVKSIHGNSSKTLYFYITKATLTKDNLFGVQNRVEYDPAGSRQDKMKVIYNNKQLVEGTDYIVSYDHAYQNLGLEHFQVTGIGNLENSVASSYEVYGNLDDEQTEVYVDAAFSTLLPSNYEYNPAYNRKPAALYVKLKKTLKLNTNEYRVVWKSSSPVFTEPGIYEGTIIGQEHCAGTSKEIYFSIGLDIEKCEFTPNAISPIAYTGKQIKPKDIIVKFGSKKLVEDVDYAYRYKADDDYTSLGQHSFDIIGKSPYGGKKTFTYYIVDDSYTVVVREDSTTVIDKNVTSLTRQSIGLTSQTDDTIISIFVGNAIESCENGLLARCTALAKADFGKAKATLEIPESCFEGCISLKQVIFPGSVGGQANG